MMLINKQKALDLIRGASVLACGGGLPYQEQIQYLNTLPMSNDVKLIDVKDIDINAVYVTTSELGPSGDAPIPKDKVPEMLKQFTQKFKCVIKGILPVEIGQESIVIDAALRSNLPIVNCDLAGMRAVPKVYLNAFNAQKVNFTRSPFVVLTKAGEVMVLGKNKSLQEDEKILREIARKTKSVIFVMGGLITGATIKKYLNYPSLTTAINIGVNLKNGNDFTHVMPLPLVSRQTVKVLNIKNIASIGFTEKQIELFSPATKDIYTLIVRNEFMIVYDKKNSEKKYQFPFFITLISPEKKRGLASDELQKGMIADLYVFKPLPFWSDFRYEG